MDKETMLSLPRHYADGREREVAMYVRGEYAARDAASRGRDTAKYGLHSFDGFALPPEVTWELDVPANGRDVPNLCWATGIRLTSEEFLAWLR